MSYCPLAVGLVSFMSVHADDFKCHSMHVAIGYGIPRWNIIVAKLAESVILLAATGIVLGALVVAAPVLLGLAPTAQQLCSLALAKLYGVSPEKLLECVAGDTNKTGEQEG